MIHSGPEDKKKSFFKALPAPIVSLGWVSFFTEVRSEIIYSLLPIFLASFIGVGALPASLIMGFLRESLGPRTAFLCGSVSALIAALRHGFRVGEPGNPGPAERRA